MNLVPTQPEHLETLQTWFPDLSSAQAWGGPEIRYPFTDVAFIEDIRWQQMPAYSMLGEEKELTGFGQYYEKQGRCHLARLVVAPTHRSKGFSYQFIHELMRIGMADLGVNECSLFVMSSNKSAISCYTALNFIQSRYPSGQPFFSYIIFMVCKH